MRIQRNHGQAASALCTQSLREEGRKGGRAKKRGEEGEEVESVPWGGKKRGKEGEGGR